MGVSPVRAGDIEEVTCSIAPPAASMYSRPAESRITAPSPLTAEEFSGVTVGGKKLQIELTMLDDESDPTKTVARLETLATQGVVAYLGGAGSDLHAAAASIGDKNKIPYLGVAFAFHGIHKQGLRYLFSPFPKSPDLTTESFVFLDAMIPAAQRPRKVALFLERTDWGKEMGSLWESTAKKHGYQIVASGEYAPGSKDFSALVLKAKSAGTETVRAPGPGPQSLAALGLPEGDGIQ